LNIRGLDAFAAALFMGRKLYEIVANSVTLGDDGILPEHL
jgi:hypothetical protein